MLAAFCELHNVLAAFLELHIVLAAFLVWLHFKSYIMC